MTGYDPANVAKNELSNCEQCQDLLIWYVAGKTAQAETAFVEQHLATCQACAREQVLWHNVAGAIETECAHKRLAQPVVPFTPSWQLLQARLPEVEVTEQRPVWLQELRAWSAYTGALVKGQLCLLRREVWVLQILFVIITGCILFFPNIPSMKLTLIALSASLCVASSIPLLYGRQADVAYELAATVVTAPKTLFLLRLGITFCLALGINALVLCALSVVQGGLALDWIVVHWLLPLLGLSSITLFITTLLNPVSALCAGFVCWSLRLLSYNEHWLPFWLKSYEQFWLQPWLLLPCTVCLFLLALWIVDRKERILRG